MTSPSQLAAISLIGLSSVFASTTSATAQQASCMPTEVLETTLSTEYNEVIQNTGVGQNGAVYTQYADPDNGGWTYTRSPQDGISCIVGSGTDFRDYSLDTAPDDAGVTTQSVGILDNGAIVHTYADEHTGEWEITIHAPNTGQRNLFAAGDDFVDEHKPATVSAPALRPAP